MRELLLCSSHGHVRGDLPVEAISEAICEPGTLLWLDISDPDAGDIVLLREEFNFHPLAIEDAIRQRQRPKVEIYDGYYFLVFYVVEYDEAAGAITTRALHVFIGTNYIVSVHQGAIRQIRETLDRWRAPHHPIDNTIGALVHTLLDAIVDDYFPIMDQVADRVEALEDAIFERYDESAVQVIFALKRDMLNMRRVVAPERDVLNVLLRRDIPVFTEADRAYLQDVYDHLVRVGDSIDVYRELLSSALDSYLSLQSNKLNQIVKVLTIASIMLMSAALIAGIYGMNFAYMPELGWRFGYPFALLLMAGVATGLLLFFKYKRWI